MEKDKRNKGTGWFNRVLPTASGGRSPIYLYQQGVKAAVHFIIFTVSYCIAFQFRFNFDMPPHYVDFCWRTWPLIMAIKMAVFWRFGMYRASWRYVGSQDLVDLIQASGLSALINALIIYTIWLRGGYPRSILIMDFLLTVTFVGGARFSIPFVREMRAERIRKGGKRVIIVGAGDAGESLLREMRKNAHLNYRILSLLDDSPGKIGLNIYGIPVNGPIDRIKEFTEKYRIEFIFIAIPSASRERMRQIVDLCRETGCKVKTIPSLDQLVGGNITISQLRDVQIEDLLQRETVIMDSDAISRYLEGKTILITGAAGSIGSEICRQVLRFNPAKILLFDQAETGMFEIDNELKEASPSAKIIPFIGDICDRVRVQSVMALHKPDVVFHAAAYKHVPMMEENSPEAVKNNILGTRIVAELASASGVERFVFISTDKAVNPTSIMGATKRVAELYLQDMAGKNGTKYVIVRFGNVLDSAGSVIPIFRRQILDGGPVTVTHPEMTRYFMTIPEATQLVLQAAAMGNGGEIFVLDMGEQVKILDLAREMIRLSGFKVEEDIPIVFTGVRPGEKLYEELWYQDDVKPTKHNKIFIGSSIVTPPPDFDRLLDSLIETSGNGDNQRLRKLLAEIVPEYKESNGQEDSRITGGNRTFSPLLAAKCPDRG